MRYLWPRSRLQRKFFLWGAVFFGIGLILAWALETLAHGTAHLDWHRVTAVSLLGLAWLLPLWIAFSQWVLRPLSRMQENVRRMDQEETEVYFPDEVIPRDEIGDLMRSHNQMLATLNEAYKEVRASQQRYQDLHDSAAVGLDEVNAEGAIVALNRTLLDWLGYTREEITGKQYTELLSDEDRQRFSEIRERFRRGGGVESLDMQYRRCDGSLFPVQVTRAPALDGEGNLIGCRGTTRDMSREKELEQQLLQAQKMEAVGLLAGGVAHDFNNLLTVILGNTELGQRRLEPLDPLHETLSRIKDAAHKAASLTQQLLAFSRRQILQPTVVSGADLIAECTRMLARVIGEDIELRLDLASHPGHVYADAGALGQVVMNLAINARDAMPQGGALTIETRTVQLEEALRRHHPDVTPGEYVQMSFTDTGIGMDRRTLEHIFEPFFTTKERGTGLGLSVAYGIVKQHGGFLTVSSQPGQGSRFDIYLPLYKGPAVQEAAEAPPEDVRGGTETIVVAEDEEAVRQLLKTFLGDLGYTVLLAGDGEEAVEVWAANRERVDLVILDAVMPRLSGPTAYEQMCALRSDLPCLFVTGYSEEISQRYLDRSLGIPLLHKPIDLPELGQKVRELLDRAA